MTSTCPYSCNTLCLSWSMSWIRQNNVFWSGKIAFKHVINNIFLNKWRKGDNNNNSDCDNDGEHYFWPLLKIDYFYKYIISMWSLIRNLSENVKDSHITQTVKMVECCDIQSKIIMDFGKSNKSEGHVETMMAGWDSELKIGNETDIYFINLFI